MGEGQVARRLLRQRKAMGSQTLGEIQLLAETPWWAAHMVAEGMEHAAARCAVASAPAKPAAATGLACAAATTASSHHFHICTTAAASKRRRGGISSTCSGTFVDAGILADPRVGFLAAFVNTR